MLVVFRGTAELTGELPRELEAGDVVMFPGNHRYGLRGVGAEGIQALLVMFNGQGGRKRGSVRSLEALLQHNEARARMALEGPYFALLRSGALDSSRSRKRFRDAARVFSDAFQTILLTRQATCRDARYAAIFHEHMEEELGHNELLTVPRARRAPADPILRATANWFCHQMLVLDNIDKAVLVHLVLETAGYHFHTLAKPVLSDDVSAEYFHVHAEADDDHKDVVTCLLANQHPNTYARLHQVVEDGWDMFDAMTKRIVHLVELETSSS
jgi:hypothetical protein